MRFDLAECGLYFARDFTYTGDGCLKNQTGSSIG